VFTPGFDVMGPEACVADWAKVRAPGAPFFLLLHTYGPHDPYGPKDARVIASAAPPRTTASPALRRLQEHADDSARDGSGPARPGTLRECVYEWFFDALARPANARLLSRNGPRGVRSGDASVAGRRVPDGRGGQAPIEARFREAYQSGLPYTDDILARTFAALDAAQLPPDTIVVVTSDHGEGHGEHGYLTHARNLHDEIVHVPLWVRAPGKMPAGAVVRGTCGLVDVAPTLLLLAGVPAFQGELDGRSLVPWRTARKEGIRPLERRPSRGGRRPGPQAAGDDRAGCAPHVELPTTSRRGPRERARHRPCRGSPCPRSSARGLGGVARLRLTRLVSATRDESRFRLSRAPLPALRLTSPTPAAPLGRRPRRATPTVPAAATAPEVGAGTAR
jgi:hypothetical protein